MSFPNQDYLAMIKNKQQQQQQQSPLQQQFCYPMMQIIDRIQRSPQPWNYWMMQQQFQQMPQMQISPMLSQQQMMSPISPLNVSMIPPQFLLQPQQNPSRLSTSQSQPLQNKQYVEVNGTKVKMNMKLIKDDDDMLDYDEIKRQKQKKVNSTNKRK
ncbi:unnamed protein product (macronuclear) [Paramecium tetraurelia]|uniref:Uncharacterized protein n=1 Tax=Paramecium tetraurelia TaxID=5888 RepID=A0D7Z1_PARTE|nr:uncharacterized protein GSPATT00014125001 [Paramecium tetraurelia]CAK79158.1 unnamed protein product [Paramecium tetraurelia]|eukprot:XP_001446555.1 hypothetical protein (macronuclear) [Paramecium tetraurelia strain d4-2]